VIEDEREKASNHVEEISEDIRKKERAIKEKREAREQEKDNRKRRQNLGIKRRRVWGTSEISEMVERS
jgi:hypothetical protein